MFTARKATVVLIAALALTCAAAAAADREPRVTLQPLNHHLYLVQCVGGEEYGQEPFATNLIASVGPDGLLLIDDGFPSTAAELHDSIEALCPGCRQLIVNTHHHGDHASGNQAFVEQAVTLAHRSVLERLSGNFFRLPGPPNPNRPMVGFEDSLTIHFNGETIKVVHVPKSHTAGDCYVYFVESGIVAAADLFFSNEFPYIDLPGGGSVDGYIVGIQGLIDDFPDSVLFYPGHGLPYNREDLRVYKQMLLETKGAVKAAVAAGETYDQMLASGVLKPWEQWDGSFPTTTVASYMGILHNDIVGHATNRPAICDTLTAVLIDGTVDDAVALYKRLRNDRPESYDFGEAQLNALGYALMQRDRLSDALPIFALNVKVFPEAWNVYDSFGEILLMAGDTAKAITNYKRSLELNPDNTNGRQVLERLGIE